MNRGGVGRGTLDVLLENPKFVTFETNDFTALAKPAKIDVAGLDTSFAGALGCVDIGVVWATAKLVLEDDKEFRETLSEVDFDEVDFFLEAAVADPANTKSSAADNTVSLTPFNT